jgi:hypothetical protein
MITRIVVLAVLFSSLVTSAQVSSPASPSESAPMRFGLITHDGASVKVETNDARPLAQAVVASRREYGWLVDYEDPLYSKDDLVDARTADFMQLHPRAKPLLRPSPPPALPTHGGMKRGRTWSRVVRRHRPEVVHFLGAKTCFFPEGAHLATHLSQILRRIQIPMS